MMPTQTASRDASPALRVNRKVLIAGLVVVLPLLAVLVMNLGRDPHSIRSPLIGKPAPPFSLKPVGGGAAIDLASLRGRPVVVNFWATWCVPCLEEHAALTAAARTFSDAQFLGVVYEDEESNAKAFTTERGGAYPSMMDPDGRMAIAYGVFGVPETFFIDRDGRIVEKYVGPLDRGTIATLLSRARGGTP
ncbi:MAG TPA: redoxin family protein [Myxococcales bacterium]|nr:redoxin family protein [Myxococcales bacterium]